MKKPAREELLKVIKMKEEEIKRLEVKIELLNKQLKVFLEKK